MNADRLLAHYEKIADAPDAIGRLRRFVLDLAVRGKLTDYELKKDEVTTLGQIAEFIMGQAPPGNSYNERGEGTVFVKVGEFGERFPEHRAWTTQPLKFAREGDVLICVVGATIGKLNLGIECAIGRSVAAIRPAADVDQVFLFYSLMPFTLRLREDARGTAQGVISRPDLNKIAIWLPPLAEQHRIVAKVDELMVLCDQLETQHINAAQAHEKLVNHLLDTLTQSQSAEEFNANWQRIAAHFDTLFTTEASIDALKQTLLQLAVMGKLVPQDPNDEPASELLKRIQAEKVKLIAEGKIKKGKPLPPISDEEKPFEMPEGWEWVRLTDLVALVTDGDHQAPPKAKSGVPFLIIGNLNTGNISFESCRFVPEEYYQKLDWGKRPNKNDLLYTVTGSYGIPIKVDVSEKFCVQRHVAILKTAQSTPINYLKLLLESKYALQYASEIATGIAQKTVPLTGLRIMPIAMPTEAQQKRIVDKVDELMALCDQLKGRITESGQLHQKLADVAVGQALSS